MAIQLSTAVRNARVNAIAATIGNGAIMKIFTGAMPAEPAAADAGIVVAIIDLPSPWMASAIGGAAASVGTWEDTSANAAGTAGYYRIYDNAGTCHVQGTVTLTGAGGDVTVDNTSFQPGQDFRITSFPLVDGNS